MIINKINIPLSEWILSPPVNYVPPCARRLTCRWKLRMPTIKDSCKRDRCRGVKLLHCSERLCQKKRNIAKCIQCSRAREQIFWFWALMLLKWVLFNISGWNSEHTFYNSFGTSAWIYGICQIFVSPIWLQKQLCFVKYFRHRKSLFVWVKKIPLWLLGWQHMKLLWHEFECYVLSSL